jgi:acyl-CoA thioester hydrolase
MPEARDTPGPWPELAGRLDGTIHVLPIRVYYEDTDFSGAVYHAGFLRFCERGRSDFLRLIGIGHRELQAGRFGGRGLGFVVRRLVADYLRPAGIDDLLEVRTRFVRAAGARFELVQQVTCEGVPVFRQEITIALVDGASRPVRIPPDLARLVASYVEDGGQPLTGADKMQPGRRM